MSFLSEELVTSSEEDKIHHLLNEKSSTYTIRLICGVLVELVNSLTLLNNLTLPTLTCFTIVVSHLLEYHFLVFFFSFYFQCFHNKIYIYIKQTIKNCDSNYNLESVKFKSNELDKIWIWLIKLNLGIIKFLPRIKLYFRILFQMETIFWIESNVYLEIDLNMF